MQWSKYKLFFLLQFVVGSLQISGSSELLTPGYKMKSIYTTHFLWFVQTPNLQLHIWHGLIVFVNI